MDAVVFDLFGTLVSNLDPSRLRRTMEALAQALGAEAGAFEREWRARFVARMEGTLPDGEEQFRPIADALGIAPTREALLEASRLRRSFMLESLVARPGALECLAAIRRRGLALALASDCSSETPALLDRTPLGEYFRVRACSAHLGARKPDPRIYRHVLDALGLRGERCLYVGDGNSEELPGAKRHGMITVWLDNGEHQHWRDRFVPEADFTVRSPLEVLDILDRLGAAGSSATGTPSRV